MRPTFVPRAPIGAALVLTATLALTACSEGGGGGTTPATPTISLALGASTIELTQGQNNTVTVSITRGGGYDGTVNLSLEGAPAGVSGSFAPASVPNGTASSTLTLNAALAAAAGAHNLTVRARGQGVEEKTAALALTVALAPSYTMALTQSALSVPQGASGTAGIQLTRTNFPGAVALSMSGMPEGVTASISPAQLTADVATLTVDVGAAAPAGTHALTVTGQAPGLENRTATLQLTIAEAGDFTLSVSPTSLSAAAGQSRTASVTVGAVGGFDGVVALSVTGAPAGVTTSLSATSVSPGRRTASVTLTVNVGATAAPGNYTLTLTGKAEGLPDRSATVALSVTLAGSYSLSVSPPSLALPQGGSGNVTVNVLRSGGFTGAVELSVSGAPQGVAATFSPASVTGSSSTLQLAVGASATPGTATLTIRGSAPGRPDQTATLSLQIVSASGNTAWQFCAPDLPIWVAAQDGDGPWTRVLGTSDRYVFDIRSGRGGIAYVTQSGGTITLNFVYGTASELNVHAGASCGTKTVRGSSNSGGLGNPQLSVTLGNVNRPPSLFADFVLNNVPDGPRDLVAALRGVRVPEGTLAHRFIIRRGINAAHNSTLPVLDFGTVEARDAEEYDLTLGGFTQHALLQFFSSYHTPTSGGMTFVGPVGTSADLKWHAVPEALRAAGDFQGLTAITVEPNTPPQQGEARMLVDYFSGASNRTLTFGPRLTSAPTYTVVTATPYRRPRIVYNVPSGYASLFHITYSHCCYRTANVMITAGYLGGSSVIDHTLPDLSEVPGFNASWGLQPQSLEAGFAAHGWTGAPGGFTAPVGAGVVIRTAIVGGVIP